MPFPAKVQLIQRKESQQWCINFPSAVATAAYAGPLLATPRVYSDGNPPQSFNVQNGAGTRPNT